MGSHAVYVRHILSWLDRNKHADIQRNDIRIIIIILLVVITSISSANVIVAYVRISTAADGHRSWKLLNLRMCARASECVWELWNRQVIIYAWPWQLESTWRDNHTPTTVVGHLRVTNDTWHFRRSYYINSNTPLRAYNFVGNCIHDFAAHTFRVR